MVTEGLVSVRRESIRGESRLVELEEAAKTSNKVAIMVLKTDHISYQHRRSFNSDYIIVSLVSAFPFL